MPPRRAAEEIREPAPVYWSGGDQAYGDDQDRRWWMPILVGVIALVLLTILGIAVWSIIQSTNRGTPGPPPVVTGVPTATIPPTTVEPTTGDPTPSASTASPTVTATELPPLVGLSQQTARGVLDGLGLVTQIRFRDSDQPAGTVLEMDPPAGTTVVPGDQVTLVVARRLPPPTTTAVPGTPAQPSPTR